MAAKQGLTLNLTGGMRINRRFANALPIVKESSASTDVAIEAMWGPTRVETVSVQHPVASTGSEAPEAPQTLAGLLPVTSTALKMLKIVH